MLQKGIYIFLTLFLIAFYSYVPNTMDKTIMSGLLVIVILSLVLFSFRKEHNPNLKGQYLKHSTLALIGIMIVFFQYPLDYVLGNISKNDLFIWIDQSIVVKSLTLSVIGLLCFLTGYLSFRKKKHHLKRERSEKPAEVNILILLAAVALIVYFLTVNPLYIAGYYGEIGKGSTANYASLLFQILVFASVIQKCRNMLLLNAIPKTFIEYMKRLGRLLLIMTGIYLLSVMISGDRGPLILFGLLFSSGYFFVTKKKLSLKYAVLFLFISISILSLLGIARNLNKGLNFTAKIQRSLNDSYLSSESSISPKTTQLAASVRTLNMAVDYVPAKHDFLYGRFQFQQLIFVVPFFSTFTPLLFKNRSYKYKGSASFVTWIRQGDNPTSGDGTSVITDFYFDLGLVGVILGMFFFGYLMRFAEINMYVSRLPSLFIQVFAVVYLCYTVYIARTTLLFNLRTVVWIYLILLANKHFLQRKIR